MASQLLRWLCGHRAIPSVTPELFREHQVLTAGIAKGVVWAQSCVKDKISIRCVLFLVAELVVGFTADDWLCFLGVWTHPPQSLSTLP